MPWILLYPRVLPRFCHQLDFSTSGALCVALNKAAAGSAYKCFKERLVTKAYLALVSPPCHPCLGLLVFLNTSALRKLGMFSWRRERFRVGA